MASSKSKQKRAKMILKQKHRALKKRQKAAIKEIMAKK